MSSSATDGPIMDDGAVRVKAKALAVEYSTAKDIKEALICLSELKDGRANMALVVEVCYSHLLHTH